MADLENTHAIHAAVLRHKAGLVLFGSAKLLDNLCRRAYDGTTDTLTYDITLYTLF